MAIANVKRIDGDLVLPLSTEAKEELSLDDGSVVDVSVSDGCVVVTNKERQIPRYKLAQLLAEWDQMPQEMKEYREWVDAPRVGRELI